jgi:coenzyme F420-reducing hydrogenase delta subunit
MCTGRVDLAFVLRAFEKGADGVIVGGCWPGECHYVTEGNYDALGNIYLGRRLLEQIGIDGQRLRLEWIAASEGTRFAEVMSDFARELRERGPLGAAEGIDPASLALRLRAATRLIPYLKLVEREKLRIAGKKSEQAYQELYAREETRQLFERLVADQLVVSQILLLLGEGPLSSGQLAERLGLDASSVARHMIASSGQGLVRFDPSRGCYALA